MEKGERMKTDMPIPESAGKVLQKLGEGGFEGFLVGGCVRDNLLGKAPKDYDVTTNARVAQTKALFEGAEGFRVIETGVQHGTVTVLSDGVPIEVTTYRVDGAYSDGRHPDSVTFSDGIEDDLSRRDFTINAIAYSPAVGFVDLFGGAEDLEHGVIRCVGEPDKRFDEDALRILRALRFASVLGFGIEAATAESIHRKKALLSRLAKERVTAELFGLLGGEHAAEVLRNYSDVVAEVLPPVAAMFGCAQDNPYHIYDVWEHTLHVVDNVPPDRILRLAALLHDVGKPHCKTTDANSTGHFYGHGDIGATICGKVFHKYLRTDKKTAERVTLLVKCHDEPIEPTRKIVHRRLAKYGEETLRQLLALHRADVRGQSPAYLDRLAELDEAERILEELLAENACIKINDLRIDGNDLLALGFERGPSLGETLHRLLDEVCEGSVRNEKAALKTRAMELLKEDGENHH